MRLWSFFDKLKFALSLPKFGALLARLYRDERVPALLKAGGIVAALLVVSPLDPFSDIPVLGVLDDTALLMLAARAFVNLCPDIIVAEHRRAVGLAPLASRMKNVTPHA